MKIYLKNILIPPQEIYKIKKLKFLKKYIKNFDKLEVKET